MPAQPPVPHLLTPYVSSLPQSSLTILSSVLGATGNWLVLRFLYTALSASTNSDETFGLHENGGRKKKKVVLVSFLRGWEFWKSEAKRLGLDLPRLTDKSQFAFVDGLSELFHAPVAAAEPSSPSRLPGTVPRTVLPIRSQPSTIPARAPQTVPRAPNGNPPQVSREIGPVKRLRLSGNGIAALDSLEQEISTVVKNLSTGDGEESEVLLIIDQPDLLLAATGPSRGIGATEMNEWIMGLQQSAYATVMILAADSPLIQNASASNYAPATPLETEHAAFAIGSAHRAQMVIQLRNLETGVARDISGVLRISKGGAWGRSDESSEGKWEEKEVLYFVQRDGGVSVFGRGE
ncbi:hypothetical protein EYZ11_009533 [Aspergillus tanneri]|uniref:Elongator complex protein 6 n=1 Tax=Aspergillus tanneri TaxID=1220188 RepID=A0A4S3J7N7_9EURO|nr:uncharacterized protein ATNIH1004_007119 [Aspergillus tanneri]KAA8645700.1 hypothetical protein ATNIH1004_007119 [Aspergillus tanneri]THC91003.1 hypothetical protein EYZ11_009533 [Aspergillus tanneri]